MLFRYRCYGRSEDLGLSAANREQRASQFSILNLNVTLISNALRKAR
jgi:hypothetical protein